MMRKWRVKKTVGGRWIAIDPDGQKWTRRGWRQRDAFAFALDHATGAAA